MARCTKQKPKLMHLSIITKLFLKQSIKNPRNSEDFYADTLVNFLVLALIQRVQALTLFPESSRVHCRFGCSRFIEARIL